MPTPKKHLELFVKLRASKSEIKKKLLCDELTLANAPLGAKIVRRFLKTWPNVDNVPFEDFQQAAAIGIWKAVKRFDPERGFAFSTLAGFWILDEIQKCARSEGHKIITHVPKEVREAIRIVKSFRAQNGRDPSSEEIGIPQSVLDEMRAPLAHFDPLEIISKSHNTQDAIDQDDNYDNAEGNPESSFRLKEMLERMPKHLLATFEACIVNGLSARKHAQAASVTADEIEAQLLAIRTHATECLSEDPRSNFIGYDELR